MNTIFPWSYCKFKILKMLILKVSFFNDDFGSESLKSTFGLSKLFVQSFILFSASNDSRRTKKACWFCFSSKSSIMFSTKFQTASNIAAIPLKKLIAEVKVLEWVNKSFVIWKWVNWGIKRSGITNCKKARSIKLVKSFFGWKFLGISIIRSLLVVRFLT